MNGATISIRLDIVSQKSDFDYTGSNTFFSFT